MSEDSKKQEQKRVFLKVTDEVSTVDVKDLQACAYCGRKAAEHPKLKFIQNPSGVVYTCEVCVGQMVSVLTKDNV